MRYALQYAAFGALAGLVAPTGLLFYGIVRGGLPDPLLIFLVMVSGGVVFLGSAGWMIGLREDALAERNANLHLLSIQLQEQSSTDALTGIANRRSFDWQLAREVARAARYRIPLALVMIDLDHFKVLNDTHGHPVGDQVLRAIAHILDLGKRTGDFVCRYGGEEFVALLPHAGVPDAQAWSERVREMLERTAIDTTAGPLQVTASFGVAELERDGTDPDELTSAADGALYEAKRKGRNQVFARLRTSGIIATAT
ncbi:MAG: GGDEF domain-containing protein [Deltaproteobacteria bacterium]|nr:GGDEF domain-containing protein [Deltaproteobacteria bacterium]